MTQRDAVDVAADALRAAVCREHRLLLANLPKSLSDLVVSAIVQTAKERDDRWRANMQAHGAALRMIREAVEEFGPVASLESEDAVLLRGPEPCHSAEAIIDALARISTALRSASNSGAEAMREAAAQCVEHASRCLSCGVVFDDREPHTDETCAHRHASWEGPMQPDMASAIRALPLPAPGAPASPWRPINIVFDGPPGPVAGRFVEVETDDGKSINIGEWVERPDGCWVLRIEGVRA